MESIEYYQQEIYQLQTALKTCQNKQHRKRIKKAIVHCSNKIIRIRLAEIILEKELVQLK